MQDPVDQEKEDLLSRSLPDFLGIPPGGIRRDDYIAQDFGLEG